MRITLNPDADYARKKKKAIKKNNGFCVGEKHVEEWRCPCKKFRNMKTSGWCSDALYYKDMNATDDTPEDETEEEESHGL